MALVQFVDNQQPYLNADNLNNNFGELNNNIGDLTTLETTDKTSLVGAVNEVMPTSGSNTNGAWIKFPDGTMICTKSVNTTISVNNALGSIYYNGVTAQYGDLPQTFTQIYATSVNLITDEEFWATQFNTTSTTKWPQRLDVFSASSKSNKSVTIEMIAIGRWK